MNAWIAVIGTLGGVAITALAGLVAARQTIRGQREAAQAQRDHDVRTRQREERRAAYVGFLTAYQALASRAIEVAEGRSSASGDVPDAFGVEERELFSRAYQELLITAARPETIEAARRATATLWEMVRAAPGELPTFRTAEDDTRGPRRALRDRMRDELLEPGDPAPP